MISIRQLLEVAFIREANGGPASQENLNFHSGAENQAPDNEASNNASTLPGTTNTNDQTAAEGAKKGPAVTEQLRFHKVEGRSSSQAANASKLGTVPSQGQAGTQDD